MALATWAQQLLRESLWVPEYPYHHQMMTSTYPEPLRRFWGGNQTFENFQVPLVSIQTAPSGLSGGGGGH